MAANKFATMLHRNTPKLMVILIYAALEWTLITLVLLNSLLTYLVTKFANYFGLKPPCPLCSSRLEHFMDRGKSEKSYTDLVCDAHATEISNISYCSHHKKLAESHNMCGNCLPSHPSMPFISWFSDKNNNKIEKQEKLQPCVCSCCCESFSSKLSPPFSAFEPNSWIEAVPLVTTRSALSDNGYEEHEDLQFPSDVCSSSLRDNAEEDCPSSGSTMLCRDKDHKAGSPDIRRCTKLVHQSSNESATTIQCFFGEGYSLEAIPLPLENGMICDLNHRLIPVELIDFSTTLGQGIRNVQKEDVREQELEQRGFDSDSKLRSQDTLSGQNAQMVNNDFSVNTSNGEVESLENSPVVDKKDLVGKPSPCVQVVTEEPDKEEANDLAESKEGEEEEEESMFVDHIMSRVLGNKEASEPATDQAQAREGSSSPCFEIPNVPDTFLGQVHTEEAALQEETSIHEKCQEGIWHLRVCVEPNEPAGVEEYVDGNVVSEMEGGNIERLKAELSAERKALSDLYAELEEERSASAIAANQTMAMITRLQEEKAAMQMEALQYQRMMEEQSEYDQDALQLLNELMNKKEKEKQQLEKELEICQKKVQDYEEKEKTRAMSRGRYGSVRSRNSSPSCSHSWDSDALSIDLNADTRDEDSGFGVQQDSADDRGLSLEEMALDCVKNMGILDESLAGFEEERLSILDQLKALQEKLVTLGENEEFAEDFKSIEHSSMDFGSPEIPNGLSMDFPLLEATDNETEPSLMHRSDMDSELNESNEKIAIEEEVDHVYERLQSLEADRDFLKHCMSSIKKGDKGVDLLQEILQHLRDLRVVEPRQRHE